MLWVDADVCACTPASFPTRVSVCFMVCNGKEAGGVCVCVQYAASQET